MINYLDLETFREFGFLQEANRQFFHPLGLALEVKMHTGLRAKLRKIRGKSIYELSGIWDYRDDPEGIFFADFSDEDHDRAGQVEALKDSKASTRIEMCGDVIQPLDVIPEMDDIDIIE